MAIAVLLALAAGALAWRARTGLRVVPDVLSLVATEHGKFLSDMAAGRARQGRLLLEGDDGDALVEIADAIGTNLSRRAAIDFQRTLRSIAPLSRGLVSGETRELLREGRFKEVVGASAARLFGPVPPLFSVKDDPFLLATDYAMSLQSNLAPGWSLKDGYPACERNGRHFLLLDGVESSYEEAERLRAFAERFNASAEAGTAKVWCCGPLFHTARSVAQAKREINVLSAASVVLVALLGWLLFRSWRFVPQLLASVGAAFFVAAGALFAFFPHPHVLTFVFGTTLIGLAVDYVYHTRAAGGADKIVRPLTQSLATSLVCFAPLLFADIVALRQMALFTMAGLVAVYLCAFAWKLIPEKNGRAVSMKPPRSAASSMPPCRVFGLSQSIVALLALVAACGVCRMKITSEPAAFYRPSRFLAEGEKRLLETSLTGDGKVVLVKGKTLQESLEIEEAMGLKGLSAVIPSLKRQRENAALVEKLREREGVAYTALTGLKMPKEDRRGFLDAKQVEDEALKKIVRAFATRDGKIVLPCPEGFKSDDPRVAVIDPRRAAEYMFDKMYLSASKLFGVSFVALALLLLLFFRRRFFDYARPVGMAFFCTVGMQGWLGIPFTCFTLLCFFVMMGLGLDYVIFHRSHPAPETRRTVLFSFLSSLAGFGMLAFTEFPVTHAMGVTLALGLFFAYALSGIEEKKRKGKREDGEWHEQKEQSAGEWRMRFMWLVYRWLGKGALKIVCVPVMAFIYPFAGGARRAVRGFYDVLGIKAGAWRVFRHLLGFAWALADKTDACTLKKELPAMSVRDDAGWRAFQACVRTRRGAFLVSTHVGTIEVLPALAASRPGGEAVHVHAFQQLGHDAVFTRLFMKHLDAASFTLHAVEAVGVETAVEMQAAIRRGAFVLMAGDRVSAGSPKTLACDFLGRACRWPKGVFAFARLMEAPIFFITCVRTGWNAYEVHVRAFEDASPAARRDAPLRMLEAYVGFLEEEARAYPAQWYQFYDFFNGG